VVGSAKLSEIKNSTPGIGLNFWNPLGSLEGMAGHPESCYTYMGGILVPLLFNGNLDEVRSVSYSPEFSP